MLNKLAIVALIAAGVLFVSSSQPRPVAKASPSPAPIVIDNRAELDALKADIERLTAELARLNQELAKTRSGTDAQPPPDVAPVALSQPVAAPAKQPKTVVYRKTTSGGCQGGQCDYQRRRPLVRLLNLR